MQPIKQPEAFSDAIEIVADDTWSPARKATRSSWKILVVDDDAEVHAATRFALGRHELLGRPLDLIEAHGSAEAQDALLRHSDIAVILLDVVMEEHDSGLKFARWVRESGLDSVRIILRTGQPGYAPELEVIRDYDINDYRSKSELTQTRLITSMTAAIRSYQQIATIEHSRRGLEMIVASCSSLFRKRELADFSHGVLMQIASLCGVDGDGMICAVRPGNGDPQARVVSGLGKLAKFIDCDVSELPGDHMLRHIALEAAEDESFSSTDGPIVLSVDGQPGRRFVAALDHDRALDSWDAALLRVFSANIAVGFENVGLIERLDRLAFWDDQVDLPNRHQLLKDVADLGPQEAHVTLIRMVSYSETLVAFGQALATGLLREVANALEGARGGRQVYRFAEDVLAVIMEPRSHQASLLADLGARTWSVGGHAIRARFSIGWALAEADLGAATICDRAYAAMSLGAVDGASEPVAFDAAIVRDARGRIELIADLRDALASGAVDIVFQPIVDMGTGRCTGAEALARWTRNGKPVSPAEFIPLAEQTGLTFDIFTLGVNRAAQVVKMHAKANEPFYVSVNLSPRDLERPELVPHVVHLLARNGIPPESLQIEVTEQSLVNDFAVSEKNLSALKALGCRLAIDDFGTGYSSLSYIGKLPTHTLKLDRQFIVGLSQDPATQAIVGLTVELARRLNLEIVAEGVETEEQQAVLQKIGFRYAQGYRFGKPMSADALCNWMKDRA